MLLLDLEIAQLLLVTQGAERVVMFFLVVQVSGKEVFRRVDNDISIFPGQLARVFLDSLHGSVNGMLAPQRVVTVGAECHFDIL